MALVLTGILLGMRPVGNPEDSEYAAGAKWQFLSMEISDPRFGGVYSCQLSDRDPQYSKLFDGTKLLADLTGHKVKVTIRSIQATQREIEEKETGGNRALLQARKKEGGTRTILQTRIRVTNLRDLGIPEDEE